MRKAKFIFISLLFMGCDGIKVLEIHRSPGDKYILQVELDQSERGDEHLGLRLLNSKGDQLDYVITGSGNHMKWAVTWYDDRVIILDSHDVGLVGWRIVNNRMIAINYVTEAMDAKCVEAFTRKYGSHGIKH